MDLNHLKISYKKILLTKNIADYQCLLSGAASGSRTRTTLGHRILSPSRLPIPTPPHNLKTALKLIISQSRQPLRQFSFGRIQDSNLQKGFLLLLSFYIGGPGRCRTFILWIFSPALRPHKLPAHIHL